MIISAGQPYFCPYPGFFYRAQLADVLVILDDVQFPRGTTWLSRNRFKNDQGALWLTIPVWKKGLGLQAINRVEICYEGRWPRKHLESLKVAYNHAPYLEDQLGFLEELFSGRHERLVDLNLAVIRHLMRYFKIDTELVLQSELGVTARGTQLLIDIAQALRASTFLVLDQVKKFLEADLFEKTGIELRPFKYEPPVYPQLWGDFLANLSMFDMALNCGFKARGILIGHHQRQDGGGAIG
jgi:hypothetical protein